MVLLVKNVRPKPQIVRVERGQAAERGCVLSLLISMGNENALAGLAMDKVEHKLDTVIAGGMCFLGTDGNTGLIGTIGGLVVEPWYSRERFIGDAWNFVSKRYRSYPIAKAFVDLLKREATARGLPLQMGVVSPKEPERKDRFMLMQGFLHLGGNYIWSEKIDGFNLRQQ